MDPVDLDNFKCPACKKIFCKPIFQCVTGHSLCFTCKAKVQQCLECTQPIITTRNFLLEQLISTLKLRCNNTPCIEEIVLDSYTAHVNNECMFKKIICKFPACSWSGKAELINDHIRVDHKAAIASKFERLKFHQLPKSFIEHDNHMFFISSSRENNYYLWTAEATTCIPTEQLELTIKIVSPLHETYILKQPVAQYVSENSELAKNTPIACLLQHKVKGCEFYVSIDDVVS